MSYIGNKPAEAYTSFAVQHFTTSATTSYTLDHSVANENEIALFINNVRQEPGSSYAYTASGTALTLSAATTTSDTMYCVFIGKAVQTVTPANGSVTNDMLAGSIANSKLANSSITLNGSAVSLGGSASVANTPAFLLKQTSQTSLAAATRTKINIDSAVIDTASGLDTTNKRWIVPSGQAGKYFIFYSLRIESGSDFDNCNALVYKNGTAITSVWWKNEFYETMTGSFIEDLSVGDYLELYGLQGSGGSLNASSVDFGLQTFFGGYKIIE